MKKRLAFEILAITGITLALGVGPLWGAILSQGAQVNAANGIYFDSQDRLHVASFVGREIAIMNRETGLILQRLGPEAGVDSPDDLILGPDGSLYWTSILTGEVGRRKIDGSVTKQFVALGVNPITFSEDGRLFVALDFLGDGLYELDPELEDPPILLSGPLGFLNGMDFGPDGFLYGPIFTQGKVVRIDVNVDPVTVETVVEGFGVPTSAVKFDGQGRLHVLDALNGTVSRVELGTGLTEVVGRLDPGLDNLAFDSSDRLFVSSFVDGSISEVLADGTIRIVSPGGLCSPQGLAVLPRSGGLSLYVADQYAIRELDADTGLELGMAPDLFVPGLGIPSNTISRDGDLMIVTGWFNNVVAVWDPVTLLPIEEHYDFAVPVDALRFQGDLVVSELGEGRVVRQTETERLVLADVSDGIFYPTGLAASGGDLWVADWATGQVWQLVEDGVALGTPILVASGLVTPEGLAVDSAGDLLVVESLLGRLSRIDLESGQVEPVAVGLAIGAGAPEGMPPHWGFSGVAVGPSGEIYVSGELERVIYRFDPVVSGPSSCVTSTERLCLQNGRFGVETSWRNFQGTSGPGRVANPSTNKAGNFWFFDPENLELLVKVIDGCAVNGHYWAFMAGATNVRYFVTVTDIDTGFSKTYGTALGMAEAPVLDSNFEACQ